MSRQAPITAARAPKQERGKQRVTTLLDAAASVFAEKGYDAATMTEIAARAGAPIGSLYQFFPSKDALADSLVQNYVTLLASDLDRLEERAMQIGTEALADALLGLLRAHPRERAAALPLADARMDEATRRLTFRQMLRKHLVAILRARAPQLAPEAARDCAVVLLQLMKSAGAIGDEDGLPRKIAAQQELRALTMLYLEQRLGH